MAENCALLGKLASVIRTGKWCIILTWLLVTAFAALGAMRFMSVAQLAIDPPEGSQAYDANSRFASVLPEVATTTNFVALVSANDSQTDILSIPQMFEFCLALRSSLNSSGKLLSFTSNASLWTDHNVTSGSSLVSKDKRTMMIQWEILDDPFSDEARQFAHFADVKLRQQVQHLLPHLGFSGIISTPTIANLAVDDGQRSLESMDSIALPIAFAALWITIQSGRLLLIPLINLAVSLSVSFGLMYCVALVVKVESTTPMLMMSLLIAMTIDYSLFLLTRFREELTFPSEERQGESRTVVTTGERDQQQSFDQTSVHAALTKTLSTAGFTVFLSCFTLVVCFLAVAVFPVDVISSMGLGCAISLTIVLAVNLTLGPAILSAFPSFFVRAVSPERLCARCFRQMQRALCRRPQQLHLGSVQDSTGGTQGEVESGICDSQATSKRPSVFWTWLARVTTSFPANVFIILGVVAITTVVGRSVSHMKLANSMLMAVPRGTNGYETVERLHSNFGVGAVEPYRLLIEPKNGGSVLEESSWEESGKLLKSLHAQLPRTQPADFTFANFVGGSCIPYAVVAWCLHGSRASMCPQVLYLVDQFTNEERTAMYGLIVPEFFPGGSQGLEWLKKARDITKDMSYNSSFTFTLIGAAADQLDVMSVTYQWFAWMIPAVLLIAVLMLGVAFKSLLIPLRSVASIVLTLLWVFGGEVLVYQDAALDWLGAFGLSSTFKASSWILPVICFSMVVGICLDYDIFLLTRTTEYREQGYDPIEAIRLGLCSTGGIITLAGVIMTIAFGGLSFASLFEVNVLSYYMVVAVLYDTFIIRCLFAPAAMSLLGRLNWYPSSLGKPDASSDLVTHLDPAPRYGHFSAQCKEVADAVEDLETSNDSVLRTWKNVDNASTKAQPGHGCSDFAP